MIGQDGKIILIRHGGTYKRVSSNRVIRVNEEFNTTDQHEKEVDSCCEVQKNTFLKIGDDGKSDSEDSIENVNNNNEATIEIQVQTVDPTEESVVPVPVREEIAINTDPETCSHRTAPLNNYSFMDYKVLLEDEWKEAIIIGRAGKATGKNRNWYNVKDTETGVLHSLDMKNIEWKNKDEVYICSGRRDVDEAKYRELENWSEHKVYEEVEDIGQNVISLRWVLSEKMRGDETVIKARLVARGFEEEDQLRTDSTTCCKQNLRLAMIIITSKCWTINSLDIKCAFLQGKCIDRELFVKPPPEMETIKIWKLKTAVYGLKDASRTWYLKIKEELTNLGVSLSRYGEALFYWHHNSILCGIIAVHVDDLIWGGSILFKENIIDKIKEKFAISSVQSRKFRYLGLNIIQNYSGIMMHQNNYINDLKTLVISPDRLKTKFASVTKKKHVI